MLSQWCRPVRLAPKSIVRSWWIGLGICFFIVPAILRAQPNYLADSLEKTLENTTDIHRKVDIINELSWAYRYSNLEKSKSYAQMAIQLGEESNYPKGWSSGCNTLALIIMEAGDPKKAIELFEKGIKGKEQIGDKKGVATFINNKGIAYANLGQFEESRNCYQTALKTRLTLNDKKGIGDCYNQLGKLARDMGNYQESIDWFKQSLAIRLEINDKRGTAYSYINLGANYSDQSDYMKSMENILKAIPLLEEIKDKGSLVAAFNNLGICNKNLKNYPEAIRYNEKALELAKESGFTRTSVNAWKSLGDTYLETNDLSKARNAFETCLKLAEELQIKGDQGHCYSGIALCFERQKDYTSASYFFHRGTQLAEESGVVRDRVRLTLQEADYLCRRGENDAASLLVTQIQPIVIKEKLRFYQSEVVRIQALIAKRKAPESIETVAYFEKYAALKDSIYKDELPRQFAEQQTRFETARKEAELLLLRKQEEINSLKMLEQSNELHQRNTALGLSALALLSLSMAGYFYFRKQKSEAREKERMASQNAEEAERVRLAKDIHDEFGSGLTKIRIVTEMAIQKAVDQPAVTQLLEPISKTATQLVDNMRDLIWVLNPANNTLDILTSRIREYATEYLEDFGLTPLFVIPEKIPALSVSKEAHRNILMVVKEALQNVAKHAEAKTVNLQFDFETGFLLTIADDGKGFEIRKEKTGGNGLLNMATRMERLGGKLEVQSDTQKGTVVILQLPHAMDKV